MESVEYKGLMLLIKEDDLEFDVHPHARTYDITEWFGYDASKTTKTNVLNAVDWGHITKEAVYTDDAELQDFIKKARTRPRDFGWFGGDEMFDTWGFIGIGTHRDADTLQRSNFDVIKADLQEKFGDDVDSVSCSHWAVGWSEGIRINLQNVALCQAVLEWHGALEGYPVADDEHWSNLEMEERLEAIENWGRQEALTALRDLGYMVEDDELTEEELEVLDRTIERAMYENGECYFKEKDVAKEFAENWEGCVSEWYYGREPWKRKAIIEDCHAGDDFDVYLFEAGNGLVYLDTEDRVEELRYEKFHHLFDDALPEKVKEAAVQLRKE